MNPQVESARAALAQRPEDPAAHYSLAQALDRAGDPQGAIMCLHAALQRAPKFAEAHNLLGILLGTQGSTEAAIASFRQAIAAKPDYARAYNNLGNSLKSANRFGEAERAIAEAVRLQPDYQLAQHNLGAVRLALGRLDDAVVALSASLQLNPQFRPGWIVLAAAERQRGRLDESIAAYRQAIALDPGQALDERIALAETLSDAGMHDDALRSYGEALRAAPAHLPAALGMLLSLPQIYPDAVALDRARDRFASGLIALERDFERFHAHLDPVKALEAWRWSNFFLAYQGRDDRDLQQRYARLVRRAIERRAPQWLVPVAARPLPGRRIRVGFASAFFSDGTIGQYFKRWITELDRFRFEVFIYDVGGQRDAVAEQMAKRAERFHALRGSTIAATAATIRSDALDVLVYPELGMDAHCVVLAALRLAPVQCAGWGHPVTSGHPTIDHFLSVAAMESADADAHYTERLVRLPGIGTSYPRPAVASGPSSDFAAALRRHFDLAPGTPLFACPQALFKILPDDDALLVRALEAVPDAVLVLFAGRHPVVTERYTQRLNALLIERGIDGLQRVRVMPRTARHEFLQVLSACTALLDTRHWSGGNTSLDALAAGLPIVALPGELMRSRQSAAMLTLAGVDELIAVDEDGYLQIATRLAREPAWRAGVVARINSGSARLFDDPEPLRAFAQFLEDCARATAGGQSH